MNISFNKTLSVALPILLLAALNLRAETNSGDQVVLVYNSRVADSRSVAEHYAEMRHVPKSQILGYSLPTGEAMSRNDFRTLLQEPLNKDLIRLKLFRYEKSGGTSAPKLVESKIRYVALCFGIPILINQDNSLHSRGADKIPQEIRRNSAAVDSDLACLPILNDDFQYDGPINNRFYNATNASVFNPTNGLLMVTRLDGPYAEVAMHLVDKAMEAETNGLWGRAYFDLRGLTNGPYLSGDRMLRSAYETCRNAGYETIIDSNEWTFPADFPMSQIAIYAGWYDEHVSGPFARPKVEFMPGAFAYHLHSFNASTIRSTTSRWVGPLLAKGAATTIGTVDEPYLPFTTDIAALLSRWIYLGFTYGEAAYAGQTCLSWQTIIVGDPLYRPFVPNLSQRHQILEKSGNPKLEWSYEHLCNVMLLQHTPPQKVIESLEQLPLTGKSPVLSEKLGDLYFAIGNGEKAVDPFKTALKLSTSAQQRVRLTLDLAGLYKVEKRTEDLFDLYAGFVIDSPDYPDKLAIYRELAEMARGLGRLPEAQGYDRIVKELSPPPAK